MQVRALIYFDEVVRTRSLRAAAERLNVAPTALARQIDHLEHYFGTPLLERSARGIRLTAAGELLAERAGRTLRELDNVRQLIDDLAGLKRGRVAIQASGAVVASLLAPALADFSTRFPGIRFDIAVTSARQSVEALVSAEADIAVTLFSEPHPGTKVRLKAEILYDMIASTDHPLAAQSAVSVADLARHPLALPDRAFGARQAFDALFAAEGLSLDPIFVTASLEMLKELTLSGVAVTLLPAFTVQRECRLGQLVARPVVGGKALRTPLNLAVASERQLPFAATKLLDHIDRFLRDSFARPVKAT
ncbi:LysR family transcriptional regulator [Rhizobium rhizosphaerae]|uniref:HTH-type transcriptional regulator TtuA n=1 Tax=Xaviernesmea rhizosphaerae TaxID=1672749 RepID=A0A1Q9ADR9_9HYPH|nr:LysR family transcriptional regulator [Xaviernesmea rhizosphaerae]OLP53069.1 LysR family transcriptional regulator [Xaviernesmea rhizosphaerae]